MIPLFFTKQHAPGKNRLTRGEINGIILEKKS